jgi:WD40 repeat protein
MGQQYLSRLEAAEKAGKPIRVTVELPQTVSPLRVLKGHTQDITSVAVGKGSDGKFFVVSTSEDRYLRVWRPDAAKEQESFRLPCEATPTTVACSSMTAASNWVVVGDSDGQIWIRRVDAKAEPVKLIRGQRRRGPPHPYLEPR